VSTLNVATVKSLNTLPPAVQNSSGTEIGTFCRAWVNFNGTGTIAIRASFNVSSITDNGNGDYTVNLTTAMPDANYSWSAIGSDIAAIRRTFAPYTSAPTSSAFRFLVTDNAINQIDAVYNAVAIFR
jgi:hypothetical protein